VAGKPSEGRKKALRPAIYVRLSEEMDDIVRTIAEREERDIGVVVRQLVREGLERRLGIKLGP
jgi:hypothetical protein